MLPAFDDYGNLPPGIHRCTLIELEIRFGIGSEEREAEIDELKRFVEVAFRAGVRRILVNGSFVTGKLCPNDVDVVFLPGPDYPRSEIRLDSNVRIWPYLQVIETLTDEDFESWGMKTFAFDRKRRTKGVVEVFR